MPMAPAMKTEAVRQAHNQFGCRASGGRQALALDPEPETPG